MTGAIATVTWRAIPGQSAEFFRGGGEARSRKGRPAEPGVPFIVDLLDNRCLDHAASAGLLDEPVGQHGVGD